MRGTAPCRDLEPLLAERASGPLAPDKEAWVAAHLRDCAWCRAEATAYARALSLAMPRLAPIGDAELSRLATTILAAVRRSEVRTSFLRWWLGAGLAAAAAAVVALAPVVLGKRASGDSVSSEHRWEAPDLDALWKRAAPPGEGADDELGAVIFAAYDGIDHS